MARSKAMASLSKHQDRGFRIHWRFTVRVGPLAGETVRGSLLLGQCTPAAAKARLPQIEDWEEAVKTGRHVPGVTWTEVNEAWLGEQALTYTEQTLARARRVLGLYERWREDRGLPCKTIEQVAERRNRVDRRLPSTPREELLEHALINQIHVSICIEVKDLAVWLCSDIQAHTTI